MAAYKVTKSACHLAIPFIQTAFKCCECIPCSLSMAEYPPLFIASFKLSTLREQRILTGFSYSLELNYFENARGNTVFKQYQIENIGFFAIISSQKLLAFETGPSFLSSGIVFECICHLCIHLFTIPCNWTTILTMMLCSNSFILFSIHLPLEFSFYFLCNVESTHSSHQVLKILEKEYQSCSHHCSQTLFRSHELKGRFIRLPLTLNFLFYSFILFFNFTPPPVFCFSEDLRLCSLKSLFPMLSNGKGNDRQKKQMEKKEAQLRKTEGSWKKCCASPQMKFGRTWWATFIICRSWKAAEVVVRTLWSIRKFSTLMSKLGKQLSRYYRGNVMKPLCSTVMRCYFFLFLLAPFMREMIMSAWLQRPHFDRDLSVNPQQRRWCHWCNFSLLNQ